MYIHVVLFCVGNNISVRLASGLKVFLYMKFNSASFMISDWESKIPDPITNVHESTCILLIRVLCGLGMMLGSTNFQYLVLGAKNRAS